jgi:hypothetical protein
VEEMITNLTGMVHMVRCAQTRTDQGCHGAGAAPCHGESERLRRWL